jgi:hypothetical protein
MKKQPKIELPKQSEEQALKEDINLLNSMLAKKNKPSQEDDPFSTLDEVTTAANEVWTNIPHPSPAPWTYITEPVPAPPPADDGGTAPKKPSAKSKKNKKTHRCAMSGAIYPEDHPNWMFFDPYWVLSENEDSFKCRYLQSCLSGKYFNVNEASYFEVTLDGTPENKFATSDEILSKGELMKCSMTGYYFKKELAIKYKNSSTPEVESSICSPYAAKNSCVTCDATGLLFNKGYTINVEGIEGINSKYKHVCKGKLKELGLSKCGYCSSYVLSSLLKYSSSNDAYSCPTCFSFNEFKGEIKPHDFKPAFKTFFSPKYRYGHTVKDGEVFATWDKAPVIPKRMFGIELEVELNKKSIVKKGKVRGAVARSIRELLTDFVFIKEDGTLTMNGKYSGDSKYDPDGTKKGHLYAGFEIVSNPADLEYHRKTWSKLESSTYYKDLRAWDTETCGMHVHVSKDSLTMLQLGRILEFVNHSNNRNFVEKVAGRSAQKYTRYLDKNKSDSLHPERVCSPEETQSHNRHRRVAVNVSNSKTVEFRIFRGTVNPRHIIRNIEFCDAICTFCLPAARSLNEFSDPKFFIEFVGQNRKQWPLLAEWMAHWELIKIKSWGPKADIKRLTLNPKATAEPEDKRNGQYAVDKEFAHLHAPAAIAYAIALDPYCESSDGAEAEEDDS